ncbi:tRNA (adenosine(37)-N6)-threonylcarbamoyltransferase complex ATPase subunit type 1 TsaE [Flavobacteriales bacterium]|nr:tRNA (adenosine(37)-N6)-threonylcarbamoyltransferase complex ATPase subunit type 1 TsaE [Flavobacteriales bacterium]
MINFVDMEFVYRYNTIDNFAKKITPLLKYKLVFLEGELGSGKTTLIKQFCKELGFKNQVTSPTFPLLNIYKNNDKNIYHADLYRLKNIDEINELGFYEIMENNDWFFVEWPELLYDVIDFSYTKIKIKNVDDINRIVTLTYNEF